MMQLNETIVQVLQLQIISDMINITGVLINIILQCSKSRPTFQVCLQSEE